MDTGERQGTYPLDAYRRNDILKICALFLGWTNKQPLHVVVSLDSITGWYFIIIAYNPDTEHFESDYKTRRVK